MNYFNVTNPIASVYQLEDPRGVLLTLLVGSARALLVDTGAGIGNALTAVRQITDMPLTVVNTHGHIDHIGGNYLFPEVYLNAADWIVAKRELNEKVKSRLISLGGAPIPEDFDRDAYLAYQLENVKPVEAGAVFYLGNLTVQAVSLPSHSPGSMGFLCPELQLFLSGDCIAPVVYLVFPECCVVKKHIEILRKVLDIPFSNFLSSHSKGLIPKEKIRQLITCAETISPEEAVRFRNPMFPESPGWLYVHRNPEDRNDYAALVYTTEKLG